MNTYLKLIMLGLALLSMNTFAKSQDERLAEKMVNSIKIENNAELFKTVNHTQAKALGAMVKANGYRCNSISSVYPFVRSKGYTVYCNNYQYNYEIRDMGGNWEIVVNN